MMGRKKIPDAKHLLSSDCAATRGQRRFKMEREPKLLRNGAGLKRETHELVASQHGQQGAEQTNRAENCAAEV